MECRRIESFMDVFVDYKVKKLFLSILLILLSFFFAAQATAFFLTNKYKQDIINHDYAIAGYLYESDIDINKIKSAFIIKDSEEYEIKGQEVLQSIGYTKDIDSNLLPEIKYLEKSFTVSIITFFASISVIILIVLLIFFNKQNNRFMQANEDILSFMYDNKSINLNDNEEGSISQFFSTIDEMTRSLSVHITNEKKTKKFLKEIIADISHQLKTPLTALKMYNEIIQEESIENEAVCNFILKSKDQLDRMEYLILNLLKLASLDANSIKLDMKNCYMKELLTSLTEGFRTRAESENKSISLVCSDSIMLNCDKHWMLEAISNIIKNSLDHTKGNDKIEISCNETPVLIYLIIKDNGSGIHPEDINYVFKRFYRSRFSKDKYGIGIGLTLAKNIIEKHGGSISVKSNLNKGTTTYLTFPKLTNM